MQLCWSRISNASIALSEFPELNFTRPYFTSNSWSATAISFIVITKHLDETFWSGRSVVIFTLPAVTIFISFVDIWEQIVRQKNANTLIYLSLVSDFRYFVKIHKGVPNLCNYLLSSTCQAIKGAGCVKKRDKKCKKSEQNLGLSCPCRPVLPGSSFTSLARTPIC